jgi:hypothetical protein
MLGSEIDDGMNDMRCPSDQKQKQNQCGGSEVRIILAASPRCGLLNQSHTRIKGLLGPVLN